MRVRKKYGCVPTLGTESGTGTGYFKLKKCVDGYGLKMSKSYGTGTGTETCEFQYCKYGYGIRTRLRTPGYGIP